MEGDPLALEVAGRRDELEHLPGDVLVAAPPTQFDNVGVDKAPLYEESNLMCRVCRGDEGDLYYPCLCTGSIKYVHQECLMEWLSYSKKEVCELCNHKYSFQPIYRPDMPKKLPVTEIIKGLAVSVGRVIKVWLVYTMVLIAWLGVVPLTATRIYQAVFAANLHALVLLPFHMFSTDNIPVDIAKGCFLLGIFICTFISLVWLREQIIHGGPHNWLNIDGQEEEEDAAHAHHHHHHAQIHDDEEDEDEEEEEEDGLDDEVMARFEDELVEEEERPLFADDLEEEMARVNRDVDGLDAEFDERAEEGRRRAEQPREEQAQWDGAVPRPRPRAARVRNAAGAGADGARPQAPQAEPAAAAAAGDGDAWRLGDELTWQRLLGLDGSFVFIEHVFWVISLNTIFTVMFAWLPYRLGWYLLGAMGVRTGITVFPSLTSILTGYFAAAFGVFVLHSICGLVRWKRLYRLLGIVFLVLKVFLLVLMEIGVFPIVCGCWMDLCSLPLFSATLSSRLAAFHAAPVSSVFLHWMVGMVYVFYSASFVLLLREVLRPGVLWFMRNLNDPEFNPIQEMIELPVGRHMRRLLASTTLFFSAILLIVYVPLGAIRALLPSVLPYNMSLTAETPLSELSLELLLLQIILPALLEQTHARTVVKAGVRLWCEKVGGALLLRNYLLAGTAADEERDEREREERDRDEEARDAAAAAAPAMEGVVGLAAEHQALLLLREPQATQPYVRPPLFALRIVLLIAAMAATASAISSAFFVVPVSIGRYLVYASSGQTSVHELYTMGGGLYVCWIVAKAVQIVSDFVRRDPQELKEAVKRNVLLVFKLLLVCAPTVFVIPFLGGTVFNLCFVGPLRVHSYQTSIWYPWQDWAMGVLHLKIFTAAVMMGPDWWMKTAFEQIYADGLRGLRVGFILRRLVLPVCAFLGSVIALPYCCARACLAVADVTLEERVLLLRYSYPLFFWALAILSFLAWQADKIKQFSQNIRNEKYLVGTRLVNYERAEAREREQAAAAAAAAAAPSAPVELRPVEAVAPVAQEE